MSTSLWAQQPQTPKTPAPSPNPATITTEQIKQAIDQKRVETEGVQENAEVRDQAEGKETDAEQQKDKEEKNTEEKEAKDKEVEKDFKNDMGVKGKQGLPIYGNEIFNGAGSNFAPSANRPTPENYILGPGDRLGIDVTGNSVVSWKLAIAPDGTILLPGMGKLNLGGKTIENGTIAIEERLRANRFAVGNGTNVSVTLDNIRSIHISVMGEVRSPGDKNVSSLTTVFNALYESGGITGNGTYRAIEVIRNNEKIAIIDLYDYLQRGDLSSNITLRDGDIIRVPEYRVRVSMEGEVKRSAYYEVMPGENLKDVVNFSAGFSDYAYKFNIKAIQLTDREQRLRDIPQSEIESYVPLKGDRYFVAKILDRYENRVTIVGSVYRPGEYELTNGLTLKELVEKTDGLKEEAFTDRGYITRLNEDNTAEVVPFYLKAIMDGTAADILLKREDVITISSIFDFADQYTVAINGSVRRGGVFAFYNGITVDDLILRAGGFADGANKLHVQVSRRVKDSDRMAKDAKLAYLIDIDIDPELRLSQSKFKLEPFDVVSVFSLPGFVSMQVVTVTGEVMKPGTYPMLKKNDRISDILKRTEGFTAYANLKDATFSRGGRVGNIKIDEIIKHPGGKRDIILKDGDIINISGINQLVKVSGQVMMPMSLVYESMSLKDYVYSAGGFTEDALKKKSYVRYANGSVKGTKRFLFFRNYPNIDPGAEIVIPRKSVRERRDGTALAQTWIGLSASMASVAAIIFAVVNNSK